MSNGSFGFKGAEMSKVLADDVWPEPDWSIIAPEGVTPEFPAEAFGNWGAWILRSAESRSTSPGYVATALLSVAGSLIGNSYWVNPRPGWEEPPVLWVALVGEPATTKSPALKCCIKHLHTLEEEKMPQYLDEVKKYNEEKDFAEIAKKIWQEDCKKDLKSGKARRPKPDAAIAPPPPIPPKLTMSDTTAEAVAVILSKNKKGILIVADELSSFILGMDKYTAGNRGFYLSCYFGEKVTVDRKGSDPIVANYAIVGLVGNIQPDLVRDLMFRGANDGFAARWLFVWPEIVTFKMDTPQPDDAFAEKCFKRLNNLEIDTATDKPRMVGLDQGALDLLGVAAVKYQQDSFATSGSHSVFLGKLRGMAARLGLILEFLDWSAGNAPNPPRAVSKEKMACALHLLNKYFIPMNQKVCGGVGLSKEEQDAALLGRYILTNKKREFNARLEKLGKCPIKRAKEMDRALEILEKADWVRNVGKREGGTTGRKSKDYIVNPKIWGWK